MNVFKLLKYLLVDAFTFYGGGGGGKGGGSAPSAPDPEKVAAATTQTNQDTAAFNKALNLNNYSNLFGSQQSTQTGVDPQTGAPIYSTSITANPRLQGQFNSLLDQTNSSAGINGNALNQLSGLQGQYSSLNSGLQGLQSQYAGLNNALNGTVGNYGNIYQGIGQLQGGYNNLGQQLSDINASIDPNAGKNAQQAGQDAAYAAQTQYLDPQFSQQKESLDAQLANQGLTPGSEAYNNAMTNYGNQKQQAYSNAANQAIMTGSSIGAQSLNNQLNAANSKAGLVNQQGSMLGNQAGLFGLQGTTLGQQTGVMNQYGSNIGAQAGLYGQQGSNLGQQAGLYGQQVGIGQLPYSNLSSIAGMIPGYSGTGQASSNPADIAGLYNNQYQSQLANYNAQQQSANNTQSGIMGLGSAAIMASMFSDRRLKRSVKRVATWANGLGVYTYRYKWEPKGVRHLGFMADEVRKIAPFAVLRDTNGFDRVNYQLAGSAR